mmetsp:Transcript_64640/g.102850  ORF Transcript_64640/g.102850 Transcript_64640/m.102850 type:complete len:213 (-) Transcript_64640:580-1218(-)
MREIGMSSDYALIRFSRRHPAVCFTKLTAQSNKVAEHQNANQMVQWNDRAVLDEIQLFVVLRFDICFHRFCVHLLFEDHRFLVQYHEVFGVDTANRIRGEFIFQRSIFRLDIKWMIIFVLVPIKVFHSSIVIEIMRQFLRFYLVDAPRSHFGDELVFSSEFVEAGSIGIRPLQLGQNNVFHSSQFFTLPIHVHADNMFVRFRILDLFLFVGC